MMNAKPSLASRASASTLPRRPGFTILELLLVVIVIGILICLLLPAIQSSREVAQRFSCTNNLANLGIALKNYQGVHGVYPSGVVNSIGPIRSRGNGYHMSWIAQILPFIEETNLYQNIDFSVGAYNSLNAPARRIAPFLLRCPASYGDVYLRPSDPIAGLTNYAACHHDMESPIDVDNQGIFFLNSHIVPDDISDGMSYTIFVGETKYDANNLGWISGTRATLRNTGTPINQTVQIENETRFVDDVPLRPSESLPYSYDYDDLFGDPSEPVEPPEPIVAKEPAPIPDDPAQFDVGGFGSDHSKIANFLFGDGSVRAIEANIDLDVYRRLGHRADGQLLDGQLLDDQLF